MPKSASTANGELIEQSVLESDEEAGRKRKRTGGHEKRSDHRKQKSDKHKAKDEQVLQLLCSTGPC